MPSIKVYVTTVHMVHITSTQCQSNAVHDGTRIPNAICHAPLIYTACFANADSKFKISEQFSALAWAFEIQMPSRTLRWGLSLHLRELKALRNPSFGLPFRLDSESNASPSLCRRCVTRLAGDRLKGFPRVCPKVSLIGPRDVSLFRWTSTSPGWLSRDRPKACCPFIRPSSTISASNILTIAFPTSSFCGMLTYFLIFERLSQTVP